jgi:kynurenine formamidase
LRVLILALIWLHGQAQPALAGALERAMLGKAAVVDLTHVVAERQPASVGQERPRLDTVEGERSPPPSRVPSTGELLTHLDVPAAALKGKPTVAQISPRDLLVQAVVVDVAAKVAQGADYRATVNDLQSWERRNGRIPQQALVLLHTGWSKRWSDPARYLNLDAQGVARVPGFSAAAIAFLVNDRDVRGVGMDAFTPEGSLTNGGDDPRAILLAGRFQIESLTNLERLPAKGVKLVIMPLRIEGGSAPARVIAILP